MLIEKFDEVEALDQAIAELLDRINSNHYEPEEYAKIADNLTKLIKNKQIIAELKLKTFDANNKMREFEESNNLKAAELTFKREDSTKTHTLKERELELKQSEAEKPDRVSKETLAVIGANIAGIVMILGYERANVIASKAFSLIMRR